MTYFAEGKRLPECGKITKGRLIYAADSGEVLFCDGKKWKSLNGVNGKDGADGKDGKDGLDGKNGRDGLDGEFCWGNLDGMKYTLICDEDTVVINLEKESTSNCSVTQDDSTFSLVCGEDSALVRFGYAGEDGVGCSVDSLDDGQIVRTCGDVVETFYTALCGETPFNPDGDMFCQGIHLYPKCGGKAYDVVHQVCVGEILYSICGTSYFNPETQYCENKAVHNYCNKERYDEKKTFCYEDSLYLFCNGKSYDVSRYSCEKGILRGSVLDRDSIRYRTVVIDKLEWTAENIRTSVGANVCFETRLDGCYRYGSIYSNADAQNLCPEGWTLPVRSDFDYFNNDFVDSLTLTFKSDAKFTPLRVLGAAHEWNHCSEKGDYLTYDLLGFGALPNRNGAEQLSLWLEGNDYFVLDTIGISFGTLKTNLHHVRCVREFEEWK